MHEPLDESWLRELPVPERHKQSLRAMPRSIVLAGRAGPTVFSSAVADGRLPARDDGWLLGAIRETQGLGAGTAYAEFILGRDGRVELIDLATHRRSPVNGSVSQFRQCLEQFVRWFDEGPGTQQSLVDLLTSIDSACLQAAPECYWSMWIEEFVDD